MNNDTEIASGFTVGRYNEIRDGLHVNSPDTPAWQELLAAFRRRIRERFLWAIHQLERYDDEDVLPAVPGFAILSLDCILIDTIQSFREGRIQTGDTSPAVSFRAFLRSPEFADFTSQDKKDFFDYIRNGLLHNGETRKDWKVRIDTLRILVKDRTAGTRTLNRRLFHRAVVREFSRLCDSLRHSAEARTKFLRRMDAICGRGAPPLRNVYFAYGSNLAEDEVRRDAPGAEPVGKAFLPCYRLEFTKHADSRGGDAATIQESPSSTVWGFLYRLTDKDRDGIRAREQGYREVPKITVFLVEPDGPIPVDAFTFQSDEPCPNRCGPSREYFALVSAGAKGRDLPAAYVEDLTARFARS